MPRQWTTRKKGPIKGILSFCNALMILAGLSIIFQLFLYISVLPGTYISFMIIMAAIMVICGVLGFVAIFSENLCVIKTYVIIWLIAIIVQVVGICFAYKFDDLIRENARNLVEKQWNEELVHPGAMDDFQTEFKCCGYDSSFDYIKILNRAEIPSSCYSHSNGTDIMLYKEGCSIGAEKTIYSSYAAASRANWSGVVLTIIQLATIGYLVVKITNKKRQENNPQT